MSWNHYGPCPVPKHMWRNHDLIFKWINEGFINKLHIDKITTTKQSTTTSCAYFNWILKSWAFCHIPTDNAEQTLYQDQMRIVSEQMILNKIELDLWIMLCPFLAIGTQKYREKTFDFPLIWVLQLVSLEPEMKLWLGLP